MRHILLAVALIVLVSPALAETPQDSAEGQPQVTAPVAEQVSSEGLLTPAMSVDAGACHSAGTAVGVPLEVETVTSSCPFGAPECKVHDDCDAYCGDPAFGNCERQGHFPFGCCVCLG